MRLFLDLDGTLAEWRQPTFYKEEKDPDELERELDRMLHIPGYYYSLQPNQELVDGVLLFHQRHPEIPIYITTQALSSQAAKEKILWSLEKLPFLTEDEIIIIPYGENKVDYIPGVAMLGDVMVDDFNKNLIEAYEAGIHPVKYLNGINSRDKNYIGFSYLSNLRSDEQIAEAFEDILKGFEGKEEFQSIQDRYWVKRKNPFDYKTFPFEDYVRQMEERYTNTDIAEEIERG